MSAQAKDMRPSARGAHWRACRPRAAGADRPLHAVTCGGGGGGEGGCGTQASVPCSPKAMQVPVTVLSPMVNVQAAPAVSGAAQAAIGAGGGGAGGRHTRNPWNSLQFPVKDLPSNCTEQAAPSLNFAHASVSGGGGGRSSPW